MRTQGVDTDGGFDRIDAGASGFGDNVAGVIDQVGVIAGTADKRVGT